MAPLVLNLFLVTVLLAGSAWTQLTPGPSRPLRAVSATQSSKSSWGGGSYPAEKCIDGVISGGLSNLCHTNGEKTPWLALDFGAVVSVEKVVINNRDDCCGDRLRDAEIRVANQLPSSSQEMFRGGELLGIFKGPANDGEEVTLTSSTELRGRFVIVQIDSTGNGIINLNEVTVWGKPPSSTETGSGSGSGSTCKPLKTMGGVNYTLIEEAETEDWGCSSDCVYQKQGVPSEKWCFKPGGSSVTCGLSKYTEEECPELVAFQKATMSKDEELYLVLKDLIKCCKEKPQAPSNETYINQTIINLNETVNNLLCNVNHISTTQQTVIKGFTRMSEVMARLDQHGAQCGYKAMWEQAKTIITFDNTFTNDGVGSLDAATGMWTAGVSGTYAISISGYSQHDFRGENMLNLFKNGASLGKKGEWMFAEYGKDSGGRSLVLKLAKDDKLTLKAGDMASATANNNKTFIQDLDFCVFLINADSALTKANTTDWPANECPASLGEAMTLHANCDDVMKVYFDGVLQPSDPAMANYKQSSKLTIPGRTQVLAIECNNDKGGAEGILASIDNGVVTDETWSCSRDPVDGWTRPGFQDTSGSFTPPVLQGTNGAAPWGVIEGIKGRATWIRPKVPDPTQSRQAYCRKNIAGLPTVYTSSGELELKRNTLLTTLPYLGLQWEVSVDYKPTNYDPTNYDDRNITNILHLTIGGNIKNLGDRTPAIFYNPDVGLLVRYAIGSDPNSRNNIQPPPPLGEWTRIVISQLRTGSTTTLSVKIGDADPITKQNPTPREFSSVKVFASDNFYPAQPGYIRRLIIKSQ